MTTALGGKNWRCEGEEGDSLWKACLELLADLLGAGGVADVAHEQRAPVGFLPACVNPAHPITAPSATTPPARDASSVSGCSVCSESPIPSAPAPCWRPLPSPRLERQRTHGDPTAHSSDSSSLWISLTRAALVSPALPML